MEVGRAYDEIALRYAEHKRRQTPASWSAGLLHRWSSMLPPAAVVLDLGCGPGVEAADMLTDGLRPVGLDLSSGMLALARTRLPRRVVQGDATRLPLRSASMDGVWSLHALLHVPDLVRALEEVARILTPTGLAALTVALGAGSTTEPVPYQPDVVRQFVHWSQEEALAAVTGADLQVLDHGVDTDGRGTLWLLATRQQSA